jgi:hypothetical protein
MFRLVTRSSTTTTLGIASNNSTIGSPAPDGQEMSLPPMISGGSIVHQAKGEKAPGT